MFLPTPPAEGDTEPGVVERKECIVSMPGCPRALDVISTAAEPTITKGEEDPGWGERRAKLAICCGEISEALSTWWCSVMTRCFWGPSQDMITI